LVSKFIAIKTISSKICYLIMISNLRKIVIVILSLVILVSSSGFSAFRHYCNCCGNSDLTLFPGLLSMKSFCCSPVFVYGTGTAHQGTNISRQDCCFITYLYVKVQLFFNENIVEKQPNKLLFEIHRVTGIISDAFEQITDFFSGYSPPNKELFGKFLILFTHNLKIPFF